MWLRLVALVCAAVLEIGGDAAIRRGLLGRSWLPLAAGAVLLTVYGFAVNLDRTVAFGRLMGVYIAVFFVVSQVIAGIGFAERPTSATVLGGALIVVGGVILQLWG